MLQHVSSHTLYTVHVVHVQAVLDVLHDPAGNLSIVQSPLEYDPRTRRKKVGCGRAQPG